jgi:hypothetical protein
VIDGQSHKMNKSPMGEDLYEFDYQLPAGRDEMAYYFLVQYQFDTSTRPHSQEMYTEIFHTKIARRYVLSLEVNRGPVGARVNVLGRGFTAQDTVYLDNQPARTVYESPNSISFFIPAVPANRNYKVMLGGTSGNSFVGTLRVDPSNVQVFPTSLTLHSGEVQNLTFTLPYAATAGGLLLDVTTDVPESVIMPEVVVPAGQSSVSVPVQLSNWHPLTWISHMLDCQLYGLNPGGHHLTNVLLHTATAILLFLVLRRMTGFLWRSAFVAAVFAIHPLRVESVAWVAERKDVERTVLHADPLGVCPLCGAVGCRGGK